MEKKILRKIQFLQISTPYAEFGFSERLQLENFWTSDYAVRVIAEYKRFLFMAYLSKGKLSPSADVDIVWHTHMTYTKSYWIDLCQGILGFDLHHMPSEGGKHERQQLKEQYAQTLEFYKKTFSEIPEPFIWPDVKERFSSKANLKRIDVSKHCISRTNKSFRRSRLFVFILLIIQFIEIILLLVCFDLSELGFFYVGMTILPTWYVGTLLIVSFATRVTTELKRIPPKNNDEPFACGCC